MTDRNDPELARSLHELADAYEAHANPESKVAAAVGARLHRGRTRRVVATVALTAVIVLAVSAGLRVLSQPSVGGPAVIPPLSGLFVTQTPDADGHCHAVRLYDTTVADARAALWRWTAGADCTERTDNLATGIGRAGGVQLSSGAGIVVEPASDAPPELAGLRLVIDPRAPLTAYPSVQAAADGTDGIALDPVERLEVDYRPQ